MIRYLRQRKRRIPEGHIDHYMVVCHHLHFQTKLVASLSVNSVNHQIGLFAGVGNRSN